MEYSIDVAVIGAGVIGLAIARALSLKGREVVILEGSRSIGTGNSSRNSEVLHAGIYYPKDSLKAKLCVQGKNLIYNYCEQNSVLYNRCGKLIVATAPQQISELEGIENKAVENGVLDLKWINSTELQKVEPEIRGVAALFSPSTGLVDTHGLMLSFQSEFEAYGGVIAFQAPVIGGKIRNNSIILSVGGPEPSDLNCHNVINCGGIHAQQIARRIEGFPEQFVPETHYAKGNYFVLNRLAPFRHLIYPVPDEGGLGIHLTLDLSGRARFGPDVEWVDKEDYFVDPSRSKGFYKAIRSYWPSLPEGSLSPDYAGIRPKLRGAGSPPSDFIIQGQKIHGKKGLINLFGIESPGITASMAIANLVSGIVAEEPTEQSFAEAL